MIMILIRLKLILVLKNSLKSLRIQKMFDSLGILIKDVSIEKYISRMILYDCYKNHQNFILLNPYFDNH